MSATEKRVEELLERWLASVERHARYLQLDDAAYARAESWPQHQRPNALVVNLARTRLLELKSHLLERRDAGDARFAESLELMSFLTSLLGSEHIDRFIPLATGKPPDTGISATIEQPRLKPAARSATAPATHKRPARAVARSPAQEPPAARTVTRAVVPPVATPAAKPVAAPVAKPAPTAVAPAASTRAVSTAAAASASLSDAMIQQVLGDAGRMLQWGREWPAIPGLIARMADRPSEADIWKILRAHRAQIMAKGRRSTG